MADATERPTDKERGEQSKAGWGRADEQQAPQKETRIEPNLAPPAENDSGPSRDDGLGQPAGAEPDPDQPVPSGDPYTESDRTDLQ